MTDEKRSLAFENPSLILLILGAGLIVVSFLPLGSLSTRAWTMEDSEAYGEVTRQLHESTYQTPSEAGRTAAEMERYRANLQQEFAKLKSKLEHAQQEPQRWSRILLWTGAALVGVGGFLHLAKQSA